MQQWYGSITSLFNKIDLYITSHTVIEDRCTGMAIRELCGIRDGIDHLTFACNYKAGIESMCIIVDSSPVVDNITQSGVLAVGISDHLVIYCTRKVTRVKSGCHKCVKDKSLKKYTKDQFNEPLMHCGFDRIYDISNVNEAYAFSKTNLAPIKEIRIKHDTKPWMCSEILDLIKQRDYYLKMFKQPKSSTDIAQHHMLRNQVTQKSQSSIHKN